MKHYHISPFEDHLGKPWYWGSGGSGEQPNKTKPLSPKSQYKCDKCSSAYGTKQGLKVHQWTKHKHL